MPISFLDYLDTRKVFKGYKEPKSGATSGSQAPNSKKAEGAETREARNGAVNGGSTPEVANGKDLACWRLWSVY